jgi:acetylornithine deacetylase
MQDLDDAAGLLAALVEIESINPSLAPSGTGERKIAEFAGGWMRRQGMEVATQEPRSNRLNVLGTVPGSGGGGRSLLLVAHLDTVGVTGMRDPFRPFIERGRMFGRGAYDMKAGLAAAMLAGAAVAEDRLRGDVIVAAVCDEEYESLGVQALVETHRADGAVVTEPTEMQVAVAHKGFDWFEVEVEGRAAHGSRPHLGVDAIVKMGAVLHELERLNARLRNSARHPLLGGGNVHASLIRGGQDLASIPGSCTLALERRTVPGEGQDHTGSELRELLELVSMADPEFRAMHRLLLHREPFEIDPGHELVSLLRASASQISGREPETVAVSFWADSAFLAAAGIPTVLFGPRGAGAHETVEWVELGDVGTCAQTLALLARRFCS